METKNGIELGSSISVSPLALSHHVPGGLVSLLVAVIKYRNKSN